MNRNLQESIIVIDDYLDSVHANEIIERILELEYKSILIDSEVHYKFHYNINKIVDEVFNNADFFKMASQKLSRNITGIHEHYVSKMISDEHIDDHLDKRDSGQISTFLLYLNKDWTDNDDGKLIMRNNISILPVFNRLVLFNNTDYSVHRVNSISTTNKQRYALTGWLK